MRSRYGKVCPTIRSRLFLLLTTFSVGFSVVSSAHAATYYVATNGNDSNPGSEAAPWRSVAHATDKMVAGDTTYVKSGVYNECSIHFANSGTASAPIQLLAAPGNQPAIDCNDRGKLVIFLQHASGRKKEIGWITIEGLEIRNGNTGIRLYSTHDLTIRRNWVHGNGQGILGEGQRVLVDRNVVNDNGWYMNECAAGKGNFLVSASGGRIVNVCNKNHGMYPTGTNWTITNNLIYGNLTSGIQVAAYPFNPELHATPAYAGAANWLIANNTFAYQSQGSGIVLWKDGAKNNKIINNIFYENRQYYPGEGGQGIVFFGDGGDHTIQNNIFYATSNPGGTAAFGGKAGWQNKFTGSGNIINTANPNFEGAGATLSGVPNFKLKPGSPAIDKGQSLSQVTWDHAGGKRPFGAAFDIGAYEFGAPPDSGSPPPNPTGGGSFPSGPILRGPNGEVCPSGY